MQEKKIKKWLIDEIDYFRKYLIKDAEPGYNTDI